MKNLVLIMMSVFVLFSCKKTDLVSPEDSTGVAGVTVKFSSSDFTDVNTRAVIESDISDLTILQFKDGKLINRKTLLATTTNFSRAITLKEGFLLPIPATVMEEVTHADGSKSTILKEDAGNNGDRVHFTCFIANATASGAANQQKLNNLVVGGATPATLKDLQELTFAAQAYSDELGVSEYIPMMGYYYGGVIAGATNQINVSLTRMLAKINFTLNTANFTVTLDEKVERASVLVKSIKLMNVPKKITPYAQQNRPTLPKSVDVDGEWQNGGMAPFPAYVANDFDLLGTTVTNFATQKLTSFTGYMPENARGSFEKVVDNKEKNPALDGYPAKFNNVSDGYTYLFVELDFTDSRGVSKQATYKIYIGANSSGDMNILRNTTYNITTYIYGADQADTRIDVNPLFDPSSDNLDFGSLKVQPTANSYIINPTTVLTDYGLSLVQALDGWKYIAAFNETPALVTEFEDFIESGEWDIVTHWRTWDGANKNITGTKATVSIVEGGRDNGETNYFATLNFSEISGLDWIKEASVVGHNAVIALKGRDTPAAGTTFRNKIAWSWHLWFTDYAPSATTATTTGGQVHQYLGNAFALQSGAYYGKYIMDRNLGATKTNAPTPITQPTSTADAVKYYGLMYEWGRKDPFVGYNNTANGVAPIYNSLGTDAAIDHVNTVGILDKTLVDAVNNPSTFYMTSTGGEWTDRPENLWKADGGKATFDPCPAGWRVPMGGTTSNSSQHFFAGFGNSNPASTTSGTTGYSQWKVATVTGNAGGLYKQASSGGIVATTAWYPAQGYYNGGRLLSRDSYAFIWSARLDGGIGQTQHSVAEFTTNAGHRSSFGMGVRCIQDYNL